MFSFRSYRRAFRQPLHTAHGLWAMREGFIVCCEQHGKLGFGEVAPLPEFGTETLGAAAAFLQELAKNPDLRVPPDLPCCVFGVSAAVAGTILPESGHAADVPAIAGLLPAGARAEASLRQKASEGYRTFKWKVGVEPLADELAVLERLLAMLPTGGRLRLDANGALALGQAREWLAALAGAPGQVEFLEQPLELGREPEMADLMESFGVPIALDESLNGTHGLRWLCEWPGPLVVKPLLMGNCGQLVERLQPLAKRVVLSSVFETGVGLSQVRSLLTQLPALNYAIGFDTMDGFDDNLSTLSPEAVWNALRHSN